MLTSPDGPLRKMVTTCLKAGLADNWSQVRMATSVLCRVFFVTLQELEQERADSDVTSTGGASASTRASMSDLHRALLPAMCLNRFCLAQGVKLHSHETWKIVFGTKGRSWSSEQLLRRAAAARAHALASLDHVLPRRVVASARRGLFGMWLALSLLS